MKFGWMFLRRLSSSQRGYTVNVDRVGKVSVVAKFDFFLGFLNQSMVLRPRLK